MQSFHRDPRVGHPDAVPDEGRSSLAGECREGWEASCGVTNRGSLCWKDWQRCGRHPCWHLVSLLWIRGLQYVYLSLILLRVQRGDCG